MESSSYKTTPYSTRIQVVWDNSSYKDSNFIIKYRVSSKGGDFSDLKTKKNDTEIDELISDTQYDINVYYVDGDGDNHALFKTTCKTNKAEENELIKSCERAADRPDCPTVYNFKAIHKDKISVPTGNVSNYRSDGKNDYIYIYDIIAEYIPSTTTCDEKTLLMLGATGTGKSTLIESLINYMADVSYSDDHRFSIIRKSDEERLRSHRQHESQTTSVTLYRIPDSKDMKVSCRVNIIDTPGFDDTRNTTKEDDNNKYFDKRIEMQIKHLLETIVDHLDAILIVVPMGETRLTNAQKHIFSSIGKLFGSNVKENVFIAMTKDDGGNPDCLNIIKAADIPYAEYFRFNNSNVFTKKFPTRDADIWRERKETYTLLFKKLETAPKTSVQTSVDVMNARFGLQLQLEALKNDLSELTQEVVNANINKEQTTECALPVPEYVRQYTGKTSMNCTFCKKTCHENCWVPLNFFNWTCEVMTSNGCLICEHACHTDKHIREQYIYKLQYASKAFQDETAVEKFVQTNSPVESFVKFQTTIEKIGALIEELKEKALKPGVLGTDLYIKELIDRENKERQEGYQLRVNVLNKLILHLKTGKSIWKLRIDSITN